MYFLCGNIQDRFGWVIVLLSEQIWFRREKNHRRKYEKRELRNVRQQSEISKSISSESRNFPRSWYFRSFISPFTFTWQTMEQKQLFMPCNRMKDFTSCFNVYQIDNILMITSWKQTNNSKNPFWVVNFPKMSWKNTNVGFCFYDSELSIAIDVKISYSLGLFPEIERAWMVVDNSIYLWNYSDGYWNNHKYSVIQLSLQVWCLQIWRTRGNNCCSCNSQVVSH